MYTLNKTTNNTNKYRAIITCLCVGIMHIWDIFHTKCFVPRQINTTTIRDALNYVPFQERSA